MGFFPKVSSDIYNAAGQILGDNPNATDNSFPSPPAPSASGLGPRSSKIPNERAGTSTRKLIQWMVPEGPIVEMYVNPKQVAYNYSKIINPTQTKGGFVVQYWGEALTTLSISGTTGTSGIEGINVLYDIYRNEQLAYDPYAIINANSQLQNLLSSDLFGGTSSFAGGDFVSSFLGLSESPSAANAKKSPTLASLAFTVEMYWSGEVYRGYFTKFDVTESADNLGFFEYTIGFTATQRRGYRTNFLGWHRAPTSGPSNSNPTYGTPYSYKTLI